MEYCYLSKITIQQNKQKNNNKINMETGVPKPTSLSVEK